MGGLKQNSLDEATTELGFVEVINDNANRLGTEPIYFTREVELEDGTIVTVESVTPEKMKAVLNEQLSEEYITFQTPGEVVDIVNEDGEDDVLPGVVQAYNSFIDQPNIMSLDEEETPVSNLGKEEIEEEKETEETEEVEDENKGSLADPIE